MQILPPNQERVYQLLLRSAIPMRTNLIRGRLNMGTHVLTRALRDLVEANLITRTSAGYYMCVVSANVATSRTLPYSKEVYKPEPQALRAGSQDFLNYQSIKF